MPSHNCSSVAAVVLLLCACAGAAAQEQEEAGGVSKQLWFDYNPRWTDPHHREIYGDIGVRTVVGDNDWVRFVARPGIRGPVGPFRLSGGVGVFYRLNKAEVADQLEVRPFQGIAAVWPTWRYFRLHHYLRLEERLEWETEHWTLDASLRGRYRLQVDYSFSGFEPGSDWRVIFHAEGFLTLLGDAGQLNEQLRVGLGLGRNVGSVLRLRADLTWQKVEAFGPSDHLYIRFRVFQGWLRGLTTHDG
jgi:hypothetical protein